MFQLRFLFLILLLGTAICSSPLYAQTDTGSVSGRVTDAAGAVIPGAQLVLKNVDTGLETHLKSNGEGLYRFALVKPGTYVVTTSIAGMKTNVEKVVVPVAQDAAVDVRMAAGNVQEVVTVESSPLTIESVSSSLSTQISQKEVDALPNIGQNPYAFAALSPGVTPLANFGTGIGGASNVTAAQQAAYNNNFMANGGTSGYNEILLDGAPITVCCQGQPAYTPSQQIVQQLTVQTSVPSAQFGLTSGGVLNNITKSGTNRLHGSASDYVQNTILNAANFFQKRTGYPVPGKQDYRSPLSWNNFNVTLGGPVYLPALYNGHDRTFFFFGLQRTDSRNYTFTTTTVPTLLQRQGDFSEAPAAIYNPYTSVQQSNGTWTRTAYANNKITNINPFAAAVLKYYPLPNGSGAVSNYNYLAPTRGQDRQYSLRLDHRFTERYNAFLRLTKDDAATSASDLFGQFTGPNAFTQAVTSDVVNLDQTYTVTPSLVLDLKYGFAYQKNAKIPLSIAVDPGTLGLNQNFVQYMQPGGIPQVQVSGYATVGLPDHFEWSHYTHFLGFSANLQKGAHSIVAGIDARQIMTNEFTTFSGQGVFSFTSAYLRGPNATNSTLAAGQAAFNSFGSFLIGAPGQAPGSTAIAGFITQNSRFAYYQRYVSTYFQDDWKLTPRLTANLGVRADFMGGMKERHGKLGTFDPGATNVLATQTGLNFAGSVRVAGQNGAPDAFFKRVGAVAPRIGLAFEAAPSLVFRGGYGILYFPTSQRFYNSANPAFAVETDMLASQNQYVPTNLVNNPFATGVVQPAGAGVDSTFGAGNSITGTVYDTPAQYTHQWNFGMQMGIGNKAVFQLVEAGSRGVNLLRNITPNDLDPQFYTKPGDAATVSSLQQQVANPFYGKVATGILTTPTVSRQQLTKKFPQYNQVTYQFNPSGSSNYNALQARLQTRNYHGVTTIFAYTWSKALSDVSNLTTGALGEGTPGYQNSYFLDQERSYSPGDVPQRFTASVVYELPFGRGHQFLSHNSWWLNELIGDFRISSITTLNSGLPLTITNVSGTCPTFSGTRPNVVAGASKVGPGATRDKLGAYLNRAAFTCPLSLQLGSAPRLNGDARSPGNNNTDLSLSKIFNVAEYAQIELRVEARNAFNRTRFNNPVNTFGSSNFGQITSAAPPRNGQVAVRISF